MVLEMATGHHDGNRRLEPYWLGDGGLRHLVMSFVAENLDLFLDDFLRVNESVCALGS